jgi:hypothetical protein
VRRKNISLAFGFRGKGGIKGDRGVIKRLVLHE